MKIPNLASITSRLPAGTVRAVGKATLSLRSQSPVILFAVGITAGIATVVLASKATLKLGDILDESAEDQKNLVELMEASADHDEEGKYKRELLVRKAQTAGDVARLYFVPFAVGVVAIGALTGSHVLLVNRNNGILAAYATLNKAYSEYRKRVGGEIGEEKERELYYGVETREVLQEREDGTKEMTKIKILGKGKSCSPYARFFDETSDIWHREMILNRTNLRTQLQWANDQLVGRGYIFLNEVYKMLGMEPSESGHTVGWIYDPKNDHKGGDGYIDFGVFDVNNELASTAWINGDSPGVLLDFNVDGVIYNKVFGSKF